MNEFFYAFEALIANAVRNDTEKKVINKERLSELEEIFEEITEVIGNNQKVTLKLFPTFSSGSVSAELTNIDFNREQILKLKTILEKCDTFEMYPLVSGHVSIGVTVPGVFDRKAE